MQVILLEKVENLGNLGDTVKVRSGYGRNYLIPSGKATAATPQNLAAFESRRAELERAAADTLTRARGRLEAVDQLAEVTITAKAGDEGKLFGSVGAVEIADAVTAAGVALERHEVRLPAGSLRQLGEHMVHVHLHSDVNTEIKVIIVPEA